MVFLLSIQISHNLIHIMVMVVIEKESLLLDNIVDTSHIIIPKYQV